jgi:hypothetical protein
MIQFLADHIDQLDLSLDQLAMRDRNFDRFALMLIDNVVELTLHRYAKDRLLMADARDRWGSKEKPEHDPEAIRSALGPYFEPKVKLARDLALVSTEVAESIRYLHALRNAVYHEGVRHERILHSVAVFYFETACEVLKNYSPPFWSSGSRDRIPHRALKYIGESRGLRDRGEAFKVAWSRLSYVATAMGDTLVADLHADMVDTIDRVDRHITFMKQNWPDFQSRHDVVVDAQVWPLVFTDEAKRFAEKHKAPEGSMRDRMSWLATNYPLPARTDPIPSWHKRADSLRQEKSRHSALKKYSEFIQQTEKLREQIEEAAGQLEAELESRAEAARGG